MKDLNFSYNWNGKLDCDFFTTIRLSDYYKINDEIFLQLKKIAFDTGKIVVKIETKIEKLTELVCLMDTGYDKKTTIEIIKKMYPGILDWSNQSIFIYGITRKYPEKSDRSASKYAKERMNELKQNPAVQELIDARNSHSTQ